MADTPSLKPFMRALWEEFYSVGYRPCKVMPTKADSLIKTHGNMGKGLEIRSKKKMIGRVVVVQFLTLCHFTRNQFIAKFCFSSLLYYIISCKRLSREMTEALVMLMPEYAANFREDGTIIVEILKGLYDLVESWCTRRLRSAS